MHCLSIPKAEVFSVERQLQVLLRVKYIDWCIIADTQNLINDHSRPEKYGRLDHIVFNQSSFSIAFLKEVSTKYHHASLCCTPRDSAYLKSWSFSFAQGLSNGVGSLLTSISAPQAACGDPTTRVFVPCPRIPHDRRHVLLQDPLEVQSGHSPSAANHHPPRFNL